MAKEKMRKIAFSIGLVAFCALALGVHTVQAQYPYPSYPYYYGRTETVTQTQLQVQTAVSFLTVTSVHLMAITVERAAEFSANPALLALVGGLIGFLAETHQSVKWGVSEK